MAWIRRDEAPEIMLEPNHPPAMAILAASTADGQLPGGVMAELRTKARAAAGNRFAMMVTD